MPILSTPACVHRSMMSATKEKFSHAMNVPGTSLLTMHGSSGCEIMDECVKRDIKGLP
ncbi:hypothetical protein BDD14_3249 [Edaphobacter modestus]|uniref:Uncharacterized protein n=1 Tax=Edaphobacter modestus TaxID=388466 RepID=A0A4Q7YWZ9_9BACT|nr:hypothetical protein BDD14_3249 [Edaphobacter modestus]